MKKLTQEELKIILSSHAAWLVDSTTGERANLYGANLQRANLYRADLHKANLRGANLQRANLLEANLQSTNLQEANLYRADLQRANLRGADFRRANLQRANLRGADLRRAYLHEATLEEADLREANLREADLHKANLRGVDFRRADLRGADLQEADLKEADLLKIVSERTIIPLEGQFKGYKKLSNGAIATLLIPSSAKRMGGVIGRKCRASNVKVLQIEGGEGGPNMDNHTRMLHYRIGSWVKPDNYDDDVFNECSNGIHFFITKEEAKDYT